jgi:hypothetical protein
MDESTKEILTHYYKPERFQEVYENVGTAFKVGGEYECRCGDPARLLAISNDKEFPLIGEAFIDGAWYNQTWTADGRRLSGEEDDWDIVEAPKAIYVRTDGGNHLATINPIREGGDILLFKTVMTRNEFKRLADAIKQ